MAWWSVHHGEVGERDGLVHRGEEGSPEEVSATFLGQEEGTVETRKCMPSLPMCIEDRGLFGCFYLLKMKDYNAILGLDWLEEHYALVDCRGRKINFHIPEEDEFSHPFPRNLVGRFVISAMKVMQMVNKGCETGVPVLEEDIVRSDSE
ncbi:hypothetical protein Taro_050437 [Colocasia esculenta]|uniref:Uncharacterized protein n=1 Tax=Colocasia esculenta TaxID=4460 RepID=A0A843XDQ9_COLES|nr:hypothetical protein [Colocasia esculenta]